MPPCETQRVYQPNKDKTDSRTKTKKIIKKRASQSGWKITETMKWKYVLSKSFTKDRIEVEILKDNKVKLTVPGLISAPNHQSAEAFVNGLTMDLGGVCELRHTHGSGAAHTHHHHA